MIIIVVDPPLFGGILNPENFPHPEHIVLASRVALDQLVAEKEHAPVTGITIHGKFPAPVRLPVGQIKGQQDEIGYPKSQSKNKGNDVLPLLHS